MKNRVLVVEDETFIRKGIILSIDWYSLDCDSPLEAGDGEEAIEKIQIYRPDIILMDINIPLCNGLDVIANTIEKYKYSVIIISAVEDFETARTAIKYGVSDFLTKPLISEELVKVIQKVRKERARQEKLEKLTEFEKTIIPFTATDAIHDGIKTDSIAGRIAAYVEEHYNEKVSLKEIAVQLNYSETYLAHRFRQETGIKFLDYLNRIRISRSICLLQQGQESPKMIAVLCGFTDYKYFVRVFKRQTGQTPMSFITKQKTKSIHS